MNLLLCYKLDELSKVISKLENDRATNKYIHNLKGNNKKYRNRKSMKILFFFF